MEFEVKDKLWNGSINIIISLDTDDSSIEYLLTVPRISYLPIYYESIAKYFKNFLEFTQPFWLEYNSIPIKWNQPVGLLYDHLHLPSTINSDPWKLDFKFGDYPDIIPFIYRYPDDTINYERSISENFFNQLKQSSFIVNGNSKAVMNLSKNDSEMLWNAIKDHDLNYYTTIEKKLTSTKMLRIPVKVFAQGKILHYPSDIDSTFESITKDFPNSQFHVHGISLNENIKILDLWKMFKYLDDFLYIVVY
ncbi:autophagy protein 5 [[Candida] jaroonii]|uniref:Autophagy protein 5 n=1 Tax=[Candida] jaroonii TaxID=467808 RepID=A0ACA9YAT6_9ASCO|nr:autophagy protein 5 [[Candida] jaroonii]